MKRKMLLLTMGVVLSLTSFAWAADQLLSFSIEDAMNDPKIQSALIPGIALYWGDQSHPAIVKKYGEFKASKRANAFRKPKEEACRWALASSLKTLQQRAIKEGGNAVVNIRSNIYNNEKSSTTEFDCLAGNVVANSALKGDVVKLAQ